MLGPARCYAARMGVPRNRPSRQDEADADHRQHEQGHERHSEPAQDLRALRLVVLDARAGEAHPPGAELVESRRAREARRLDSPSHPSRICPIPGAGSRPGAGAPHGFCPEDPPEIRSGPDMRATPTDALPAWGPRFRLAAGLLLLACSVGCSRRTEPEDASPPASAEPRPSGSAPAARAPERAVPSRVPGALDCGGSPCAVDDVCLTCGTDVFHCVPAATACCGTLPCAPGNVCVPCPPGDAPTCLPAGAPCPRR